MKDLDRRGFCKAVGGTVAAGMLSTGLMESRAKAGQPNERPNVVLIYTDDHTFNEMGCYGGNALTPHMDSIAEDGMTFNRFYVSSAVCSPSRYSVLTGRYASRSESIQNKFPPGTHMNMGWEPQVRHDVKAGTGTTLPEILRQNGYYTGMVGKWHQGDSAGKIPQDTDIRTPEGEEVFEEHYARVRKAIRECGFDYVDGAYKANVKGFMPEEVAVHNQEWITKAALDFMDGAGDRPFFLYMPTTLTHGPWPVKHGLKADPRITPAGYLDEVPDVQPSRESVLKRVRESDTPYRLAGVTWLDDAVGAVLDKLEELGEAENTLVILASDNGKKGKFSCYDAGARLPMVARWPGKIKPGQVCDDLVSNVDFAPTFLDACGVEKPKDVTMDGRNLVPLLTGQGSYERESLYLEIGCERAVVGDDRFKYIAVRFPPEIQEKVDEGAKYTHWALPMDGTQHHTYKNEKNFPHYFDDDQLYDLQADPDERNNLAGDPKYADKLKEMQVLLEDYLEGLPHSFGEFTE